MSEMEVMRKRKEANYWAGGVVAGVVTEAGAGVAAGAVAAGLVSVSNRLARSAAAGDVGMYNAPRWPQALTDIARHTADNPTVSMVETLFTIWLILFMIAL